MGRKFDPDDAFKNLVSLFAVWLTHKKNIFELRVEMGFLATESLNWVVNSKLMTKFTCVPQIFTKINEIFLSNYRSLGKLGVLRMFSFFNFFKRTFRELGNWLMPLKPRAPEYWYYHGKLWIFNPIPVGIGQRENLFIIGQFPPMLVVYGSRIKLTGMGFPVNNWKID